MPQYGCFLIFLQIYLATVLVGRPQWRCDLDIQEMSAKASRAVKPIEPASLNRAEWYRAALHSHCTAAANELPEYYLVYMLLVELLDFKCFGPRDKVAWSIPIRFEGEVYLVEHRKFGLGVFGPAAPGVAGQVERIVRRIAKGVVHAEPYFERQARRAVENSHLSVINLSDQLYDRYLFFLEQYRSKCAEADWNAGRMESVDYEGGVVGFSYPETQLRQEAEWLAFSVIDSFFSWSEHIFIHLAILQGNCATGVEVAGLMSAEDWSVKFKKALDISDTEVNRYHRDLVEIRQQFRNFATHGAFGRNKEGLAFFSGAGIVPMTLSHHDGQHSYRFGGNFHHYRSGVAFVGQEQIDLIADFIEFIRSGPLAPAWIYLDAGLNLSLIDSKRRELCAAMKSEAAMERLVEAKNHLMDRYLNMEF